MKNNKGFALIELLVVIAIIAIAIGTVTVATSSVSSNNARKCILNINAAISRCKINTLYREPEVFLRLRIDENNNIIAEYHEGSALFDTTVMGSARMGIAVELGGVPQSLPVNIGFTRGKGRLLINGEEADENLEIHVNNSAYILEIVYLTGSHDVRIGGR